MHLKLAEPSHRLDVTIPRLLERPDESARLLSRPEVSMPAMPRRLLQVVNQASRLDRRSRSQGTRFGLNGGVVEVGCRTPYGTEMVLGEWMLRSVRMPEMIPQQPHARAGRDAERTAEDQSPEAETRHRETERGRLHRDPPTTLRSGMSEEAGRRIITRVPPPEGGPPCFFSARLTTSPMP